MEEHPVPNGMSTNRWLLGTPTFEGMRYLAFILLVLSITVAAGQKQGNIWFFGDHAGFDFNGGPPVQISGGATQYVDCPSCHAEGSAVISDSSGTLLFYSDGAQVWNAQHTVMPNGSGLLSNASSTQSALILPRPYSSQLYYLFTVDDFHLDALQNGFRYSIVDMCLDGGLGDIKDGQKNILLTDSVAEKLAAVRHANGVDYWVVVHKWQSDAFHAYPLTVSGVGLPVVSYVGSTHPTGMGGIGSSIGQMKISPDGTKLALVNGNSTPSILEYFDFDAATGVVSNPVALTPSPTWMYYGVAFSQDNSKLYAGVTMNGNGVYQFDLTAGGGDPLAVAASMVQVAFNWNYLGMQLGPDGKIYVARSPFLNNTAVGVIHDPNLAGTACNYQDAAITLVGSYASYSFPSFVDSYDYSTTQPDCVTLAVDEAVAQDALVINPVGDLLVLQLPLNARTVAVHNAAGQCVRTFATAGAGGRFDVRELSPGMYVAVLDGDGRATVRFVKE